MGSVGTIMKLQYTRLEMLTLNSSSPSVDDKIADHTQHYVADGNNKNLNEELPVDEVARDKDLIKACSSSNIPVPTRQRSHRAVIGLLTSDSEEDVYHFCRTQMIVDEKNLSTQEGGEKYLCIVDQKNLSTKEGGDNLCSTQMIVDENNSSKSKKRSSDGKEETSKKKRPNNVEKRAVAFRRKNAPQVQNYPPSELPQSLQDYISRLNMEAPPLFVAQKVLYPSDIRRDQNRLSLPKNIINTDFFDKFMTDVEKKMLKEKKHVEVSLVDDKMHEYHTMRLVKWDMNSSSNYVLRTAWNNAVKDNKLEEAVLLKDGKEDAIVVMKEDDKLKSDVVVQVWCFRNEARLWCALNIQAMTESNVIGKTKDGRHIIT